MSYLYRSIAIAFICLSYISCEAHEEPPIKLLLKLLPQNPTILEAGAHDGQDTAWMSQVWSKGTLHAFEPYPEIYNELEKVAKSRSNVFTYPLALSNKSGRASFYLSGGASSLLRPAESFNRDYFHADLDHPIEVECTTLDQWAKSHQIKAIDFMWLDMEGNELRALQGGQEILKSVKVIYTEVNLQRFWEGCVCHVELKNWLEDQGFVEVWSEITPHWHGNALFTRKEAL